MLSVDVVKALASEKRLQILHWLKAPRAHFPKQVDGDLGRDGGGGLFIADKLGVSQPTASEHLRILVQAGAVRPPPHKQGKRYKRGARALSAWRLARPAGRGRPPR